MLSMGHLLSSPLNSRDAKTEGHMKSVCHIDDDLAAPILRLLRKLLMRGERDGEEDHFSLMSLFHRNRVAVASPIPLLPPVITATLPSSAPILISSNVLRSAHMRNIHYRRCLERRIGFTIRRSNILSDEQTFEKRERKNGTADQL